MDAIDYTKLSTEELDALITKYRALGDVEVTPEEELADDDAKVAELNNLAEAHGSFHILTQPELDADPELVKEGFTELEEVLMTVAELTALSGLVSAASDKAAADEEAAKKAAEVTPEASGVGESPIQAPAPAATGALASAASDLIYNGKTVLAVRDTLIQGKTYKEVDIPNETHTLTVEDFNAQVLPREAAV